MDELTQLIVERTGLSTEQARMAAELAVNFLKEKLPAPLASQIDLVLGGTSMMDNLSKGLDSFFKDI